MRGQTLIYSAQRHMNPAKRCCGVRRAPLLLSFAMHHAAGRDLVGLTRFSFLSQWEGDTHHTSSTSHSRASAQWAAHQGKVGRVR